MAKELTAEELERARAAQREYYRAYRATHREQLAAQRQRYWANRAKKAEEGVKADGGNE